MVVVQEHAPCNPDLHVTSTPLTSPTHATLQSMEEIGEEIHVGAVNFMETEMVYLVGFMIVIFIALIPLLMSDAAPLLGLFTGLAFLFGGALSFGAGYAGMFIATKANMKTVMACTKGMSEGLTVRPLLRWSSRGLSLSLTSSALIPPSLIPERT